MTSNLITVFAVFGQYCLSLSAIISIIKRYNRVSEGCFGKLKRLPISIKSSIFNLNAAFWPKNKPKNFPFLKKCFHTLWRHHSTTKLISDVNFCIVRKFKQISIENWSAINIIFDGSRVISNLNRSRFVERESATAPKHVFFVFCFKINYIFIPIVWWTWWW